MRFAARLLAATLTCALLGATPGPPAPDQASAVSRHLAHAAQHVAGAVATDSIGRRAVREAMLSLARARAAAARGSFLACDELAASADDLVRAAVPPPLPGPDPHPPRPALMILAGSDVIASALASSTVPRVRTLLDFANSVADAARRQIALNDSVAAETAERGEAIVRAAAHAAIAEDPTLAPILPRPPKPPLAPRRPPPPPE